MNEAVVESQEKPVLDLNEKIRVLLVDDDHSLLKIAKQCLELEAPLQVDTSLSVEEALKKLENEKYDVVVSDYKMPTKDGLEFLKELRAKDNKIPFIMFTGKGREEVAIKALNLGASQYLNKVGETETVYAELAHSVTELARTRKAEEKQCESEEKFRTLFEKANDGLVFVDVTGRIVDANQKAVEMAEKRKEDVIGKSFLDIGLVSSKDLIVLVEKFNQQTSGKTTERFEFEIQKENGEKRIVEISSSIIQKNKIPAGSLAIVRDVTERKKTEETLKEIKDRLELQIKRMPIGCIVWDKDFKAVSWNPAAEAIFKYSAGEAIGKHPYDIIVPKEAQPVVDKIWQRLLEGDETAHSINDNLTKEGETISCSWTNTPLKREDGSIIGVLSMVQDITMRQKAEEALKESEERYSRLSDAAFEGIGIDEQGKIVDANDQLGKMLGYEPGELIGKNVLDFVAPGSRDFVLAKIREGFEGPYEHLAMKKDGSVFPVEIRTRIIHQRGNAARVCAIRDITDRKQVEEDLKVSEERYRSLFENSKELMITYDLNGNVTAVNKVAADYGFYTEENIGKNMLEFVPEKELPRLRKEVEEIIQGKSVESEIEIDTPKGKRIFEYISSPIRERGEIVGIHGSYKDVTESRRATEALRVSEERYKHLAEELRRFSTAVRASVDGVVISDMDGRIIETNLAALKLYGADQQKDFTGKSSLELVAPEEREKLVQNMKETEAKGCAGAMEINAVALNGKRIPVEITATLIRNSDGLSVGFLNIVRDLTEAKNQRRLLDESQQKFAGLFSGNPEATAYVDLDMQVLDVNPRFESLFGYSLDEIRGKHIQDMIVPDNLLEEWTRLNEKAAMGYVYHDTLRKKKDGSLIPVSVSAAPIRVHDKLIGYVWLYKDISQQKVAEESLKESEERFRALFAGGPEASVYLSPDFHIQDINRRFEQVFGYSLAEIKGKRLDDVIVQENKKEEAGMLNEKAVGGYVYHETVRRRKDGSFVPVSISAAPIVIKGQLSGTVGTYKDISDLRSAQEKLAVMNEKLRVVGGLTRHDIRNKLSVITGNTYLMKKKLKDYPEVLSCAKDMEFATAAIVGLLEFARDYERLGVEELAYVGLEDSIQKAVSLFKNEDQTKIVNQCNGLIVLADSLLIKLFYNLIDNSLKHGGHVTRIGISCEESEHELRLVCEDDGVGIAQEAKPKLFSEGYTTDNGSGYGLYLIKKMMEAYGWSIKETGLPGKGARFIIAIPKLNRQGKENYRVHQPQAPVDNKF